MKIETSVFTLIDHQEEIYSVKLLNTLLSDDILGLRNFIQKCIESDYNHIYLDVSGLVQVDQSGINEIVDTHNHLLNAGKKMTLLYRKGSEVENWVEIPELNLLIPIAILPAI